eukprot:1309996-Pyramimonas_sp.AAC.1
MMCIQDAGHSLVWYLSSSSISYTAIDDMANLMFVYDSVPRLVPSAALSACVADTFNQVEVDLVQTYLA